MKKIYIGILSGVGGCAVGSAVTYFLLKDKMEKLYNKDIEEAKSYYASKYYNDISENYSTENDSTEDNRPCVDIDSEEEYVPSKPEKKKITINDENYNRQRIIDSLNYHSKYGSKETENTDDEQFIQDETERCLEEDSFKTIYEIADDEYNDMDDNPDFVRDRLIYLSEDDMLIDPDGNQMDNSKLERFRHIIDMNAGNENGIYICDVESEAYYEIDIDSRDFATYAIEEFGG